MGTVSGCAGANEGREGLGGSDWNYTVVVEGWVRSNLKSSSPA